MRKHRYFVFGKKERNCWTGKQYELAHCQDAEASSEYAFSLRVISRLSFIHSCALNNKFLVKKSYTFKENNQNVLEIFYLHCLSLFWK